MTASSSVVAERDETGRIFYTTVGHSIDIPAKKTARTTDTSRNRLFNEKALQALGRNISAIFLPAEYPNTVTPGFGVGNVSASATQALLLLVLKDVCSRFTTIIGAYYFGTSLYPETKTFRFLADVINDTSIVLDTISPYFTSISLSTTSPYIPSGSTLQIAALCMSGAMRSLCSLVAGGSKAALTDHFASPVNGKGDLGTLIVPYITTRTSIYTALFFLVFGHLLANYLAVRSVILRSFNRQRSSILWSTFRNPKAGADGRSVCLTPRDVSNREIILDILSRIRDAVADRVIGHCSLGVSVQYAMTHYNTPHILKMLQHFQEEPYVLFVAESRSWGRRGPCILVSFKEGYGSLDQLRVWLHALEIAAMWSTRHMRPSVTSPSEIEDVVLSTHETLGKEFSGFMRCMKEAGWNIEEGAMTMRVV
ncbi:vitamin B6 photo-protection and homoeostasis-domain-containing protein [Suillus tomentosus]|nr:vitamin B6 photo-protection and homoeostasis-domain-containing protein [Suillus tomentosus]